MRPTRPQVFLVPDSLLGPCQAPTGLPLLTMCLLPPLTSGQKPTLPPTCGPSPTSAPQPFPSTSPSSLSGCWVLQESPGWSCLPHAGAPYSPTHLQAACLSLYTSLPWVLISPNPALRFIQRRRPEPSVLVLAPHQLFSPLHLWNRLGSSPDSSIYQWWALGPTILPQLAHLWNGKPLVGPLWGLNEINLWCPRPMSDSREALSECCAVCLCLCRKPGTHPQILILSHPPYPTSHQVLRSSTSQISIFSLFASLLADFILHNSVQLLPEPSPIPPTHLSPLSHSIPLESGAVFGDIGPKHPQSSPFDLPSSSFLFSLLHLHVSLPSCFPHPVNFSSSPPAKS